MDERQEISVHDNHLVSYEVLCERREIRFHTEFRDRGEPYEFTQVLFTGVVCYDFDYDSDLGNIIFDIDEIPAADIYLDHAEQFRAGVRFGWPGEWAESADAATAYFLDHGIRGFHLSSSLGMCGWVLAHGMQNVTAANQPAPESHASADLRSINTCQQITGD